MILLKLSTSVKAKQNLQYKPNAILGNKVMPWFFIYDDLPVHNHLIYFTV